MTARGLVACAVLMAALLIADPAGAHDHPRPPNRPRAADPVRSDSLYVLDASFLDQRERRVGLDVARGHPVIITMMYASCTDTCPLLIADIRRIEAALPDSIREDLHVVLVSLDPGRDTPERLRALADLHRLDDRRWHVLSGADEAVRDVAAVLGVRYRRLASGAINHSSVLTLLERDGVIAARLEDVGRSLSPIVDRLLGARRR
jgi:protein SCO1/2